MSLITIWLGETGSKLVLMPIDDLLHFVLATNQLQVDKRCLIPAYQINLRILHNFLGSVFQKPLPGVLEASLATSDHVKLISRQLKSLV